MIKNYHIDSGIRKTKRVRNFTFSTVALGVAAFGVYSTLVTSRAAQTVENNKTSISQVAQTPATIVQPQFNTPMPWPSYGTAAFAVPKDNLVTESDSTDKPVPVASLAKVITVLAVLKEKPLKPGEQGQTITLSERDVEIYSEYVRKNGTVIPVAAGEQISQYEALQAILMVSANNMTDSLVIQTFGSVENYVAYANKMVKELGLNNTKISDASGYSSATVSTAEDMTKMGYLYMQNPVLKEIALKQNANLPVAGTIGNYNIFTNKNGIVGIKVGDTDEAGKCFIVADIRKTANGTEEISVAVVLGADSLRIAAKDAQKILSAGNQGHDQLD